MDAILLAAGTVTLALFLALLRAFPAPRILTAAVLFPLGTFLTGYALRLSGSAWAADHGYFLRANHGITRTVFKTSDEVMMPLRIRRHSLILKGFRRQLGEMDSFCGHALQTYHSLLHTCYSR